MHRGKRPALSQWMAYMTRKPFIWEIEQWFDGYMPKNIGIVTGAISGIAVIDLDNHDAYQALIEAEPKFTETFTVKTGKGYHVYFKPDIHARTTTFRLGGNLHHIKQEGGYIVAPPSIHESGSKYMTYLANEVKPFHLEGVANVLKIMGAEEHVRTEVNNRPVTWASELCDELILEGQGRNTKAAQLCGLLVRKFNYDPGLIYGLMRAWNSYYCKPPMDNDEIDTLILGEISRYSQKD